MSDFRNAKPGDVLYSLLYGPVVVKGIDTPAGGGYPLSCFAETTEDIYHWTVDGRFRKKQEIPDLYWNKPEIIAPPKPKRMVEKTWELWVNLYPADYEESFCAHNSQAEADMFASQNRIGPAERIVIKRMVEE